MQFDSTIRGTSLSGIQKQSGRHGHCRAYHWDPWNPCHTAKMSCVAAARREAISAEGRCAIFKNLGYLLYITIGMHSSPRVWSDWPGERVLCRIYQKKSTRRAVDWWKKRIVWTEPKKCIFQFFTYTSLPMLVWLHYKNGSGFFRYTVFISLSSCILLVCLLCLFALLFPYKLSTIVNKENCGWFLQM